MAVSSVLPDSIHRSRAGKRGAQAWLRRAGVIVAALAVAGTIAYGWLPRRVAVEVGSARFAPLAVEIAEDGQTRVRDRFVVASPITGTLARIAVEPGAGVHRGEVIARVAPPASLLLDERSRDTARAQLSAALSRARAAEIAVARARVARDAARRDAARTRTLDQRGAIAAAERERADDQEQLAERDLAATTAQQATVAAEVAAARATLGLDPAPASATSLTRGLDVVSPADGQVLRVVRDSAGPVTVGAELMEIGDPRALEVVIDVLSSDAARIAPGMPVAIEAWGGDRSLAGTVRQVEPSAFTRISALGVEEQRVKVIAEIPDPPVALGDGFRVEARIFTWRGEHVLTVPASAVFRDRNRWAVYTLEDGRARLRPIELGHRGRLDVEVVAGIASTTDVVLHPTDQIVDGIAIRAVRAW